MLHLQHKPTYMGRHIPISFVIWKEGKEINEVIKIYIQGSINNLSI